MDHRNCPAPSQVTWENNQSPLNEIHIHQQNHWNDILFYWYQSYHWYQWTIGLTNRIRLCILDMWGLYLEGRFNWGVFVLLVWGAYIWTGLFSEFYGISRVHGFNSKCSLLCTHPTSFYSIGTLPVPRMRTSWAVKLTPVMAAYSCTTEYWTTTRVSFVSQG